MSHVLQSCPDVPAWLAAHVRAVVDQAPPLDEIPAVAARLGAVIATIPDVPAPVLAAA